MVGKVNPRRFNQPNEVLKSRHAEKELYALMMRRATSSVTNSGGFLGQTGSGGGGGAGPGLPDDPGGDTDLNCFGLQRVKFIDFCYDKTTLAGRIDTEVTQKLWRFDARAGTTILFEEDTDDLLSLTKTLGFAFKPWVFDQFVTFNDIVSHLDDLFMFGGDINMVGNNIIDVGGNASGKGALNGAIRIANHTSKVISEGRIGFRNFQNDRDYFFYLDNANRFVFNVALDFGQGNQDPSTIAIRTTDPTFINEWIFSQNRGEKGPSSMFVPSNFNIFVNRGHLAHTVFEIEQDSHDFNFFSHNLKGIDSLFFNPGPGLAVIDHTPSNFLVHAVFDINAGHSFLVGGGGADDRKVLIDQQGILIRGENSAFLRFSDGTGQECSIFKLLNIPLTFSCADGFKFNVNSGGPFIFESNNNSIGSPPMQIFFRAKNTSLQERDYAMLLTKIEDNFPNFESGSLTLGALVSSPFLSSPTPMLEIGGTLLSRVNFLTSGHMEPNTIFDFDIDTFAVFRGSAPFTSFSTDRLLFADETNQFHLSVLTENGVVDLEDPGGTGTTINIQNTSKGTQSVAKPTSNTRVVSFESTQTHNVFSQSNNFTQPNVPAAWDIFGMWEVVKSQLTGGYESAPLEGPQDYISDIFGSCSVRQIIRKSGTTQTCTLTFYVGTEEPDELNLFRRKPFPVDKPGTVDDFRNWERYVEDEFNNAPIGDWRSLASRNFALQQPSAHWIVIAATHRQGGGDESVKPHAQMKNIVGVMHIDIGPGTEIRNVPESEWPNIAKGAYSVNGKGLMWNFTDSFLATA